MCYNTLQNLYIFFSGSVAIVCTKFQALLIKSVVSLKHVDNVLLMSHKLKAVNCKHWWQMFLQVLPAIDYL